MISQSKYPFGFSPILSTSRDLILCLLWLGTEAAQSQTFQVLHSFTGEDGDHPRLGALIENDNVLYGTTPTGGASGNGVVFKMNTDGSGFVILKHFSGGTDGSHPTGDLLLFGPALYGTTQNGGDNDRGTIYRLNTNGSGYEVLKRFTSSDAFWPEAGLVRSGNILYGTTEGGGNSAWGTVFKINSDGSGFTILRQLQASDGANPRASLILSGDTLYGTTSGYVFNTIPGATVFKINTNGTGFAVLTSIPEKRLMSPVTAFGSTLYGTAFEDNYYGIVFKIQNSGINFTVLKTITNSTGALCWPGITGPVLAGGKLYGTISGTCPLGGHFILTNNCGIIFQMNTDGGDYTELKKFTVDDGAYPLAALTLSGDKLYGTTAYGGTSNCGVIFSLSLPPDPPVISNTPPSQTAEIGSAVRFDVRSGGFSPRWFQWTHDGVAITDWSTNSPLTLTNVSQSKSGRYEVTVTNVFGATTSSPAMLQVIPVVQRRWIPAVNVFATVGISVEVQTTDSLPPANWNPVVNFVATTNPLFYFDLPEPLPPQRFYRAQQNGKPSILNLKFVSALTLRGSVGDSLRLDCINAIGPTSAWITLDTVTLTNASQLYFDVSSPGLSQRLYRVVPVP